MTVLQTGTSRRDKTPTHSHAQLSKDSVHIVYMCMCKLKPQTIPCVHVRKNTVRLAHRVTMYNLRNNNPPPPKRQNWLVELEPKRQGRYIDRLANSARQGYAPALSSWGEEREMGGVSLIGTNRHMYCEVGRYSTDVVLCRLGWVELPTFFSIFPRGSPGMPRPESTSSISEPGIRWLDG